MDTMGGCVMVCEREKLTIPKPNAKRTRQGTQSCTQEDTQCIQNKLKILSK